MSSGKAKKIAWYSNSMAGKCRIAVKLDSVMATIDPNIYGHFIEHLGSCIYPGIWVGKRHKAADKYGFRKEVVEALRNVCAPVVRWPGGCFADFYHWEDGIGPSGERPNRINLWWGGLETNEFGTDEYARFCSVVGAEPYICLNVGSGNPKEASSWLEYCNFEGKSSYARLRAKNGYRKPHNVRYWGIGNENYACGGSFDPLHYASEYRRFATFLKRFDPSVKLIACGHTAGDWNLRFMESLKDQLHLIDYLSIHHYFGDKKRYGSDVEFTEDQYLNLVGDTQYLEQKLQQTIRIVDYFCHGKKEVGIAVDEWGVWHPQANLESGLFQQNTLRDAILAGVVLNMFNRHSTKVKMANIAQTINVLQSLCLAKGEETVLTPTYHVYSLYRGHMGKSAVEVTVDSPPLKMPEQSTNSVKGTSVIRKPNLLDVSASIGQEGNRLILTCVNQDLLGDLDVEVNLVGNKEVDGGEMAILTADDVRAHNDFGSPKEVEPIRQPIDASGKKFTKVLPRHSISSLDLRLK